MAWQTFLSVFGTVFLAEIGDKTQLATLSLATGQANRLSVFLGSAGALVCTSLLAVLVGAAISQYIPPHYLRRGAGAVFIVLGLLYLFRTG